MITANLKRVSEQININNINYDKLISQSTDEEASCATKRDIIRDGIVINDILIPGGYIEGFFADLEGRGFADDRFNQDFCRLGKKIRDDYIKNHEESYREKIRNNELSDIDCLSCIDSEDLPNEETLLKILLTDHIEKDNRSVMRILFKHLFEFVESDCIPDDLIIDHLITNCNQSAYNAFVYAAVFNKNNDFRLIDPDSTIIKINVQDVQNLKVKLESKNAKSLFLKDSPKNLRKEDLISVSAITEFELSANGEVIEYSNGQINIIISSNNDNKEEIKKSYSFDDIKTQQSKNMFSNIVDIIVKIVTSVAYTINNTITDTTHKFSNSSLPSIAQPITNCNTIKFSSVNNNAAVNNIDDDEQQFSFLMDAEFKEDVPSYKPSANISNISSVSNIINYCAKYLY